MKMKMLALAVAAGLTAGTAQAKVDGDAVNIAVLSDFSGVYAAVGGQGSVVAAQMAIDEFNGKVLGKPITLVSADHQNKADIASAKAREWIERDGVDMIVDLLNSGVGIAVQKLSSERGVLTFNTGAGSTALTNDQCTDLGIHYAYDVYSLAVGLADPLIKAGGKKWYFITADYAFGHSLESNAANVVKANGGEVVGGVRAPFPNNDFSSFLLQAQRSKADVIALANAGGDFTNAVKQAGEFGIGTGKQQLAGLLVFLSEVKALGLQAAQGTQFVDSWYWDQNDESRAFAKRFNEKAKFYPNSNHAAVYSSVLQYLKAVEAAGTDEGKAVRAQLAKMTLNDMYHKNATVRADGRVMHDMYLMKVKSPKESKGEWDLLNVVSTVPAERAFLPLEKSTCPLVAKK